MTCHFHGTCHSFESPLIPGFFFSTIEVVDYGTAAMIIILYKCLWLIIKFMKGCRNLHTERNNCDLCKQYQLWVLMTSAATCVAWNPI